MNLMTMNDMEKILLQFYYLKLVQFTIGHFTVIRWRQSLNVKIFPVTLSACKDLMEGRNSGTTVMTKQMESDLHFIYLSPWERREGNFLTFHIWWRALYKQHLMHFSWIRLWGENLENIQMRFRVLRIEFIRILLRLLDQTRSAFLSIFPRIFWSEKNQIRVFVKNFWKWSKSFFCWLKK